MLNIKAKSGSIKLLFEDGGKHYLVIRNLTPTKSGGDSTKSRLFEISESSLDKGRTCLPAGKAQEGFTGMLNARFPEIINE